MQKIQGLVRRCVDDYKMIDDGDSIAVGVSGGKDSLTLLVALAGLRDYYPKKFRLLALTLDLGFDGMDFSAVSELCASLDIPFTIKKTQIARIVFDERKEKNPCSMCAKLRRGALNRAALELGCNKVALGHHYDDAVETFLMSLLYEGRISCFQPVTYLDRSGVMQIRPLLYVGEKRIKAYAVSGGLPVVHNPCPADKHTKREEIKTLISDLAPVYPDLKTKVFGAMQRMPLPYWGTGSGEHYPPCDEQKPEAGQSQQPNDGGV